MVYLAVFILLIVLVGMLGVLGRKKLAPGAEAGALNSLPDRLPLTVKRPFFSRSEQAFYIVLEGALHGTPYTVFPNVRLNDLFVITDPEQRQSTYNRLRDKHVDFLIVTSGRFEPSLAIELDGESHASPTQQERDRVKNLVFSSAGLGLLRLDARQTYQAADLRERLRGRLPGLDGKDAGPPLEKPLRKLA